jgi:hypothetical protein
VSDDRIRTPCVPIPTGTHGESPALADKNSLIVHGNASQLTSRDSPRLCKAVLDLLREPAPNQEMPSPGGCSYVKSVSAGDQELSSPGGLVCRDGGASSRRLPGGLPPRGRAASWVTMVAGW